MTLSPNDITALLCIHIGLDEHPLSAAAWSDSISTLTNGTQLVRLSRQVPDSFIKIGNYDLTEKGLKYVEMLTETPLPVQMYLDPRFTGDQL